MRYPTAAILTGSTLCAALTGQAHFQVLEPGSDLATAEAKTVSLDLVFTHPMEGGR
jgi:uncharacterized GH25 family protein